MLQVGQENWMRDMNIEGRTGTPEEQKHKMMNWNIGGEIGTLEEVQESCRRNRNIKGGYGTQKEGQLGTVTQEEGP